jgi:hypothetical protein
LKVENPQQTAIKDITLEDLNNIDALLANADEVLKEARKNWKLYTDTERKTVLAFFDSIVELSKGFEEIK